MLRIFMATGPDEFLMPATTCRSPFHWRPGPGFVGLASRKRAAFENGKWVVTRYLGCDDSTLRRDLANAVALNQSGFRRAALFATASSSPSAPYSRVESLSGASRETQ